MPDMKVLAESVFKSVRDYVARATAGISARVDELAAQIKAIPAGAKGDPGQKGEPGLMGKDGAPGENGMPGDRGERGEKGDSGEAGSAGRDGIDGKDGAPGERGEKGLDGARGEKGDPGEAGLPGERGQDGLAGKDGAPGEAGEKGAQGEAGPPGEKGEPGINGKDGAPGEPGPKGEKGDPGEPGKDGAHGERGADGKSITVEDFRPIFEAEQAKWALDFERRAADVLQRAIERMPAPKDGIDGLSIEDLTVEHDGDGGVTLRFQRGDVTKEFTLRLPRFKDCGVFRDGIEHKAGDGVTWGGSFFIAQKDTPTGKPGESDDWRLAVKRGRDGKDAPAATTPASPVRLR